MRTMLSDDIPVLDDIEFEEVSDEEEAATSLLTEMVETNLATKELLARTNDLLEETRGLVLQMREYIPPLEEAVEPPKKKAPTRTKGRVN